MERGSAHHRVKTGNPASEVIIQTELTADRKQDP